MSDRELNRDQNVKQSSHLSHSGEARMVDVSAKAPTVRTAEATARFIASSDAIAAIWSGDAPKGDALATARIAGITAAKKTADLIPLCHPLALDQVAVAFERTSDGEILIRASARTTARTGVEMEAMVAASIAALTLYDMAKSVDQAARVGPISLAHKTGGQRGEYVRQTP